jgi:hypothetical protein
LLLGIPLFLFLLVRLHQAVVGRAGGVRDELVGFLSDVRVRSGGFQPAKNVKTRADPLVGRYFKFEQTNTILEGANRRRAKTPQRVATSTSPPDKFSARQNQHIRLFERSA